LPVTRWREVALVVAGLAFAAVVPSVSRAAAQPSGPSGFRAVAAADGSLFLAESATLLPAGAQIAGFGGPTAQATLDSIGTSQGFAAFPNPGEVVLSASSLFAAFTGVVLPVQYPLTASSDYPAQPDSSVGQSGLEISAHSEERRSVASAKSLPGLESTARVVRDDDGHVTATASAKLPELSLGLLTIEGLVATASMSTDGSEPIADLAIGRLTLGDISLTLGPEGFSIAGTNVPVPLDAVLQPLLAAADIDLQYLAPRVSETSVVAPGIVLSTTVPVERAGAEVEVSIILGNASASVDTAPIVTPSTPAIRGGTASSPPSGGSPGSLGGSIPSGESTTAVGSSGPGSPPSPVTAQPTAAISLFPPGGWSFYPVLFVAGIFLVGLCHGFTIVGRRA
jgi:hypothetical protein